MTVHLCSTVPMGEDRCARRRRQLRSDCTAPDNVYVNDASLLPDAPGVNPQASMMAIAIRNARRLAESVAMTPPDARSAPDATVVTGAAGWLGTALMHALTD